MRTRESPRRGPERRKPSKPSPLPSASRDRSLAPARPQSCPRPRRWPRTSEHKAARSEGASSEREGAGQKWPSGIHVFNKKKYIQSNFYLVYSAPRACADTTCTTPCSCSCMHGHAAIACAVDVETCRSEHRAPTALCRPSLQINKFKMYRPSLRRVSFLARRRRSAPPRGCPLASPSRCGASDQSGRRGLSSAERGKAEGALESLRERGREARAAARPSRSAPPCPRRRSRTSPGRLGGEGPPSLRPRCGPRRT